MTALDVFDERGNGPTPRAQDASQIHAGFTRDSKLASLSGGSTTEGDSGITEICSLKEGTTSRVTLTPTAYRARGPVTERHGEGWFGYVLNHLAEDCWMLASQHSASPTWLLRSSTQAKEVPVLYKKQRS